MHVASLLKNRAILCKAQCTGLFSAHEVSMSLRLLQVPSLVLKWSEEECVQVASMVYMSPR